MFLRFTLPLAHSFRRIFVSRVCHKPYPIRPERAEAPSPGHRPGLGAFGLSARPRLPLSRLLTHLAISEDVFFSVPWGHHLYIISQCKDVERAVFYQRMSYCEWDINTDNGTITVNRTIERIYIVEGERKITNFFRHYFLSRTEVNFNKIFINAKEKSQKLAFFQRFNLSLQPLSAFKP